MAKYRQIMTSFWTDPWVLELTPEQKYFYLYLLTNSKVKQCGIYEISKKQMEYETGYTSDTITKLLSLFQEWKKIRYSMKTHEICIINFPKYNFTASDKVKKCIRKEFGEVKDKRLIPYVYGIDTLYIDYKYPMDSVSIDYVNNKEEEEKEKEEEKEEGGFEDVALKILGFFGFNFSNKDKYQMTVSFLNKIKKQGLYDDFLMKLESYILYKKHSEEKLHGFKNFLGSESNNFKDGGWNQDNWDYKLKTLKINSKGGYGYANKKQRKSIRKS